MNEETVNAMKKIIAEKQKKSAQQGGHIKHEQNIGSKRTGIKSHKKGGLFDK